MNKKLVTGVALGVALAIAGTSFTAAHMSGNKAGKVFGKHGQKVELTQEAKDALLTGDFEAFKATLPEERQATISEEKFDNHAEFYQAKESGDEEALEALKAERKAERDAKKEAVKEALANNDYEAFSAVAGDKRAENLTEEKFALMVEMHEAKEAEDTEEMKEIRKEMKDAGMKMSKKGKRGQKRSQD